MNDDLWPEIPAPSPDSPIAILREQAAVLGAKTNGRLTALVSLSSVKAATKADFYIASQRLEYSNRLFFVVCVAASYPATIVFGETHLKAANPTEFRTQLKRVLQDPSTRNLLATLTIQADNA